MTEVVSAISRIDRFGFVVAWLLITSLSIGVYYEYSLKHVFLVWLGIGFGICLFHAAFGFSGGWRQFIRKRNSRSIKAQIVLLACTSAVFFPLIGGIAPQFSVTGSYAPVGISVLVGAFIFGIGMQLGGGCGSGTLYTAGQGQTDMLVTLIFFILGTTIGSVHLVWWLEQPHLKEISLIHELGWEWALLIQLAVLAGLFALVKTLSHSSDSVESKEETTRFMTRLIFGPWPIYWGVAGLVVLNSLTLVIAGHPWTITFAFGLWGAKIWAALGGEPQIVQYWSEGYPATALNNSVLADTTSIMDFGLILGALLAAALAGKFAPKQLLTKKRILTAMMGGILLGYGARLAFGCNVGALLAGIASGSVHGWLWLVAGFIGAIIGVRLRLIIGLDK